MQVINHYSNVVELFDLCGEPSSLTPMLSVRDSKVSLRLDCTRSVISRARNQIVRDLNGRWGVAFPGGVLRALLLGAQSLYTLRTGACKRYSSFALVGIHIFTMTNSPFEVIGSHNESDRSGWLHSPAAQCCASYQQAWHLTIFIQGAAMFCLGGREERRVCVSGPAALPCCASNQRFLDVIFTRRLVEFFLPRPSTNVSLRSVSSGSGSIHGA
jgi:hypothetical protein